MKDNDDYAFVVRNEAHSKSMYRWIIDSEASKHMTSYKAAIDTYEVIISRNVHLDDDSVVQAIKIKCIVVEAIFKGKIHQTRIKDAFHIPIFHIN